MVQIRLFGHLALSCNDKPVLVKSQPLSELLCYLLIHQGREHPRELLASELWGERSTAQSLKTLRQTLWQLGKLLEGVPGLTLCDRDHPRVELCSDVEVDITVLEQAARHLDHETLTSDALGQMERALSVYRGDLLAGWRCEWCLVERERYRTLYLALLDALTRRAVAEQQVHTGLQYAHEALRLEPARERTHRHLMELYWQQGDRSAVLKQYQRCARLLEEEYGVAPSDRTVALYRQACGDQGAAAPDLSATGDSSAFEQILALLRDIKKTLES